MTLNRSHGFEELAMPLFESLYRFARRLARNQSDAEDLVQETYLKAQRSFASFQPGTNLQAWMFRILKNTFLSSLATLDYRMTDTVESQADLATSPQCTTPETLLITRFTGEATRRAILRLPVPLREVILLRVVENASYREIAEVLSIPPGTAMSRLARARKLVRRSLSEPRALSTTVSGEVCKQPAREHMQTNTTGGAGGFLESMLGEL